MILEDIQVMGRCVECLQVRNSTNQTILLTSNNSTLPHAQAQLEQPARTALAAAAAANPLE